LNADEIQARIHGAARPPERQVNRVAILPLFGTIFPRANIMTDVSGATSAESFGNQFTELIQDPNVDAIILDVDSPGGQVDGIDELATKIFQARGTKPIVAIANYTMASAAYWIGSAADQVIVSPSADVGSIGVFAVHEDMSKALDREGVKMSIIKRGKYKAEGNPYEPLTEEARAAIQSRVDEIYDGFINTVARNRGVTPATVRDSFGEGRTVSARQAVELGMADRIGTLQETIDQLLGSSNPPALMQALQPVNPAAEPDSSEPFDAEKERQAQSLRDRVNQILNKEIPNA
jgi:signal peptide peptidase SppA